MPSTFTPNLDLEKPETGEKVDTWGPMVNENMDKIDAGVVSIANDAVFPEAVHTYAVDDFSPLAVANGVNQECEVTTNSGLTVPPGSRGGFFTLTLFNSSGSTVTIFPASNLGSLAFNTVTAGNSLVIMFGSTGTTAQILTSYQVTGDARKS